MAYVISKPTQANVSLTYLPETIVLPKTKETTVLDYFNKDTDFEGVYSMVKDAVDEGQTYPQETMDRDHFEQYYLSHDVFVMRHPIDQKIMGSFYVKPNFPGPISHSARRGIFRKRENFGKQGIGKFFVSEVSSNRQRFGI
ncbi:hypothetical protein HNY73_002144 [Argiope bruennichi]|uniref:Uncharacterized protein n=1 Tax=Argiope bruennichi TaxID=94029 RepID=A0A8T0FZ33_ARGBR|nr:hypothetical protein HNY73_002144 [Argiope bruennichi]